MKDFFYNFSGEFKRYINRFNLIAWLIILVLLLIQANSTTNLLKKIPNKTEIFQQIQKKNWENLPNYQYYKFYGINFLYVMPSTGIIANDTAVTDDMTSKIDFFSKVQIFNNIKSKAIFLQGKGIRLVFSVIIKLLISLMVMWYGFRTFENNDYLISLASIWQNRKNFFYTIFSRFLLFSLTFLVVMGLVLLFVRIRGINFNPGDFTVLAGFLLQIVVYLGIFFIIGAIIGLLGQKKISFILLFISWFFLAVANQWIIAPAVTPEYLDTLKDYQNELDKINIITKAEETAQKERGKYDDSKREEAKEVIEDFWNNWYLKKIVPLEKKLRDMIAGSIEKDRKISKFFPGPFFDMTANEASGRGYTNYMRFYDYAVAMQTKFVRFIIDRAYYNDPKIMVNFIQGDEDIFYGKAALPPNFWTGILIQLGYLVILIIACYFCFLRKMFPRPKDAKAFDRVSIELQSGENITLKDYTDDDNIRTQVVNTCLGEGRVNDWRITLDDKPLGKEGIEGILHIPNIKDIPGELKGKHLVRFFKRVFNLPAQTITQLETEIGKEQLKKFFRKMEIEKQAKLILSLFFLANRRYYVTNNFPAGIPFNYFSKLENHVKDHQPAGSMIIDLHNMIIHRWMNDESQIPLHYKNGKYYAKNPLLEKDKE
jgi:ABC-type transport system involved in multi-copper enzyme maturation permease subunit